LGRAAGHRDGYERQQAAKRVPARRAAVVWAGLDDLVAHAGIVRAGGHMVVRHGDDPARPRVVHVEAERPCRDARVAKRAAARDRAQTASVYVEAGGRINAASLERPARVNDVRLHVADRLGDDAQHVARRPFLVDEHDDGAPARPEAARLLLAQADTLHLVDLVDQAAGASQGSLFSSVRHKFSRSHP
jgi:hypothetical protein